MRDDYAAEVRDKHVTELDNVLYIIKALSISKPANISRKQTKFVTKLEVEKKNTQFLRFFWYLNIRDV